LSDADAHRPIPRTTHPKVSSEAEATIAPVVIAAAGLVIIAAQWPKDFSAMNDLPLLLFRGDAFWCRKGSPSGRARWLEGTDPM